MPLEKLLDFTTSVADFADKPPSGTATQVKAQFDAAPEELRTYFNNLIDVLLSTTADSGAKNIGVEAIVGLTGSDVQTLLQALKTLADTKSNSTDVYTKTLLDTGQLDNRYFTETELQSIISGTSGAKKIGATPIATSPSDVQGILEWLKTQIDTMVLGQIPDGSLPDDKLSNDPADIKQVFTAHKTKIATETEYGHIRLSDIPNPTKTSIGLGNVDNVQQIPLSQKGVANGIAPLGADNKVPSANLPAGAWEVITSVSIASPQTSIVLSSIPTTYKFLKILLSLDRVSGTENLRMLFNSETGFKYTQTLKVSGTTIAATYPAQADYFDFINAISFGGNLFEFVIANTNAKKRRGVFRFTSASDYYEGTMYDSTNVGFIQSITLQAITAGNIGVGSQITLLGSK